MGLLFTTSHGSGTVTPALTPIVSLSAQLACKIEMRVDGIRALQSQINGQEMGIFQIDANGAGSFKKLEGLFDTSTAGASSNTITRWRISSPGLGGSSTPYVSFSALPANGNDVILYAHWDQTHFNQSLAIFDATGTLLTSASTTANDGNLPVTASNGVLTINAAWDGVTLSNMLHGFALYSSSQPFASWSQAPYTGEATQVYLLKFNDPPSPTIASASTGVSGAVLATGNYYWFLDSASAQIWFPPVSVPSTISLQYPTTYISIGGFGGITASVVDQFGNPVANPTILWSISPVSTASINTIGTVTASNSGTAYVTASVSGTFLTGSGIVSVSAYDWSSNNLSIVTVDVTGTFTYRGGVGLATITCSRVGTQIVGFAGVTGSSVSNINLLPIVVVSTVQSCSVSTSSSSSNNENAAHPNEPSGFLPQIDTGQITGSVASFNANFANGAGTWTTFHNGISNTWSNTSVGISSSTGGGPTTECGYMIMLASGSGIRQRYDQQLAGGNNYVTWDTPISISGSGGIYFSAWVRFINWSNNNQGGSQIVGLKLAEPRCGGLTPGASTQENHVFATNANNTRSPSTSLFANFFKQINPGSQGCENSGSTSCPSQDSENFCRDDIAPYNLYDIQTPNANLSASLGEYVQVEFIAIQETTGNTTQDARVLYFVSGVCAYDSANSNLPNSDYPYQGSFNLLAQGSIRGWFYLTMNGTFGGSSTGPVQTQYYDIDQIYVSVSPSYLTGAAYTAAAANWTGSAS